MKQAPKYSSTGRDDRLTAYRLPAGKISSDHLCFSNSASKKS